MATNAAAIAMAMMNDGGGGSGGDVTKQYVDDHLALKADKSETKEYPIASTTTGINPTITDSADGLIQNLTVYGRTDTVEGELRGIGEDGELVITTANSDNTASTTATVTTGVPLYSVGDVKDELDEKRGVVVKRCEKKNLDNLEWELISNNRWLTPLINAKPVNTNYEIINAISNNYTAVSANTLYPDLQLIGMALNIQNELLIRNGSDTDAPTGDIVYELAEPYEIPLTAAELSALRNLRTYASTTNVTVTDNPTVDVSYLLDTDNGQAVADVQIAMQQLITGALNAEY